MTAPAARQPHETLRHMPQLDSVRTLAVFAVMLHHFWPAATFNFPFGFVGVQLFFVLSGFLITRILWPGREAVQSGQAARPIFQRFYLRRALRIFPLFYLVILLLWIIDVPDLRAGVWWHLSYLSNMYFARLGWSPLYVAHLWSLAVEEQFYLVWPFVIVLTPKRWLLPALIAIVSLGPIYRLLGGLLEWGEMWTFTPTLANVDGLAFGGILAYGWATDTGSRSSTRARFVRVAAWFGIPLAIGLSILSVRRMSLGLWHAVLEYDMWALCFVWLIDRAGRGISGIPGAALNRPEIQYLGRISYGLYVFHPLVAGLVYWWFRTASASPAPSPGVLFVPLVALTIAAAAVSWTFFEGPLNRLKGRVAALPERGDVNARDIRQITAASAPPGIQARSGVGKSPRTM